MWWFIMEHRISFASFHGARKLVDRVMWITDLDLFSCALRLASSIRAAMSTSLRSFFQFSQFLECFLVCLGSCEKGHSSPLLHSPFTKNLQGTRAKPPFLRIAFSLLCAWWSLFRSSFLLISSFLELIFASFLAFWGDCTSIFACGAVPTRISPRLSPLHLVWPSQP